ncbi:MAG TPA: beta-phosphoglucomutase, partial [Aggregatilineales bacterium]|nr:beta-phosphoglucomutase [Aggregatilineales bacterium]
MPEMPKPAAFIFDLDGVLTDTAEFHYRAWKRLADEENVPFTRQDNEQLRGVSRRQSLIYLLKERTLTEEQMQDWMERKNSYYLGYLTAITPNDLLPGVDRFLREARARGLKIGLGSASRNARQVVRRLGIADLLDAIGDGSTVSNTKPAPDLFVWVAGRLDVPPAQCVVFEDAEAGVEAALTAGMYVVGLGSASHIGKAHLELPDLEEV